MLFYPENRVRKLVRGAGRRRGAGPARLARRRCEENTNPAYLFGDRRPGPGVFLLCIGPVGNKHVCDDREPLSFVVEGEAVSRQHEPGDGFLAVLRRLHPWHRVERRDEIIGKVAGKPAGKPLEPRGSDPEPAHERTDGVEGIGRLDAGGNLADTGVAGDRQRAVRGNGNGRGRGGADERVTGGLLAPLERLQQEPGPFAERGVEVGR